tara:strand:+ start:96 stop:473 length:378 start_codon:yes stop_codon:yes gene_type:complete
MSEREQRPTREERQRHLRNYDRGHRRHRTSPSPREQYRIDKGEGYWNKSTNTYVQGRVPSPTEREAFADTSMDMFQEMGEIYGRGNREEKQQICSMCTGAITEQFGSDIMNTIPVCKACQRDGFF